MFWKNRNIVTSYLRAYDFLVNDINCKYAWRCHKKNIFENYKKNIGNNHLEIGPGTGYFLKNFNYKIDNLYLMDINNDTLNYSYRNLINNYKNVEIVNHNIFAVDSKYVNNIDSVGMNYVLHCVPGKLENKIDIMLQNLKDDKKEKTFFGATVLFDKSLQSNLSNFELFFLNKYGIFNNNLDTSENLINYFEKNRLKYSYKIVGNVIIFNFKS